MVYLVVFFKRGASQASIESNDILRGLIEDQKAEIIKLRERQHDLGNKMQVMQIDIETIRQERKYLSQLIGLALAEHFANNPEAAKAAKAIVRGDMAKQRRKEKDE